MGAGPGSRNEAISNPTRQRIEWPTIAVAVAIYTGFITLTLHHHALPWWAVGAAGGALLAWHGSLQHEVIHGHPTRSGRLNALLVWPNLWLWLPFERYRTLHLDHHRASEITRPVVDPESYFVTTPDWEAAGPVRRALLRFNHSLAGRVLIGPLLGAVTTWREDSEAMLAGDRAIRRAWVGHAPVALAVIAWVWGVCDIALGEYFALYVYPSISLTMLRSFAEHQPVALAERRTTVVESGPLLSLLFLNNNLHVVHHDEPTLPWYRLPRRWSETRDAALNVRGITLYHGYREVARRFALAPAQHPRHPTA